MMGRSFKRRRFNSRRRVRSNYKQRLIGASARAARNTYVNTSMCRDLGSLWPSCLITKLRFHAMINADNRGATPGLTNTALNGNSYAANLILLPQYDAGGGTPFGPLQAANFGSSSLAAANSPAGSLSLLSCNLLC